MSLCENCGREGDTITVVYYTAMVARRRARQGKEQSRYSDYQQHQCEICTRCLQRVRTLPRVTRAVAFTGMALSFVLLFMDRLSMANSALIFAICFIGLIVLEYIFSRPFKPQRQALAACYTSDPSSRWALLSFRQVEQLGKPLPRA